MVSQRQNLKWQINVTRAKAGLFSSMAVPKRIAQKARQQLKRKHEGSLPTPNEQLKAQLSALEVARLERQRHHQLKQLGQLLKKAKTFLLRKLVRRCKEAANGAEEGVVEQLQLRISALKKAPPAALAHAGLARRGVAAAAQQTVHAEWTRLCAEQPKLCAGLETQLLQHPSVRAHLDGLAPALAEAPASAAAMRLPKKKERLGSAQQGTSSGGGGDEATGSERPSKRLRRPGTMPGGGNVARAGQASSSVFLASLADGDGDDGGGDSDGRAGAGGFTLGGVADIDDDRKPSGKKKNYISRSGNRMGQRQRQALAERDAGLQQGGRGRGRGQLVRPSGKGGKNGPARGGAPRGAGVGKMQGGQRAGAERRPQGAALTHAPKEALHPSWEAKRNQAQASIQAFQGKRTTFD